MLSASDRVRYARQLLLPQLGETGQARLLASELSARPGADDGALEVARTYLQRAGVRVSDRADADELPLYSPDEIARMAGTDELLEAARALAGALAAVAAMRTLAGLPAPVEPLPIVALSSADAREGAPEQSIDAREGVREQSIDAREGAPEQGEDA